MTFTRSNSRSAHPSPGRVRPSDDRRADQGPGTNTQGAVNRTPPAGGRQIGRELALASLIDKLKAALGGAGCSCLVTGEAGIGKTRLVQDLLERAQDYDCNILSGKAQEYDHGIAYASLRDLLSSAAKDDFDENCQADLDDLIHVLNVTILSPGSQGRDAHVQPAYLLMTKLLNDLCLDKPTIVALDDAHLADDETLVALSFAARQLSSLPLFLLFSIRLDKWLPSSRFAATIGRLIDSGQGAVIDLDALDLEDTTALVAAELPGRPDERLSSYVYSQSRGNPLFTLEALRSLREQGAIRAEHDRYYLAGNPASGSLSRRAALLHRIFQQDRAGRELARAMSAFRRVHLDQIGALEAATNMDRGTIERTFDSLTRAAIITQVSAKYYEFTHPLIADVLYNDLGPLERRRLHKLIAESFSRDQLAGHDVLEWTTHIAEAAVPGDPDAIAAIVEAARLTRNTAPLSAATWYERALELLPPGSPQRGELLSRRAIALWKGSRPEEAIAVVSQALREPVNGDLRTRSLATMVNATYAMGRYREALELVSTQVPNASESAPFRAQQALLLAHMGRGERAVSELDQAEAHAAASSPSQQVVTYTFIGHAANCLGDFGRARSVIDRLVILAEEGEQKLAHGTRLSALESAAYLLAGNGCVDGVRDALARIAGLLPETGWQDVGGQYVYAKAKLEHMTGAWADALETIRSGAISLEFAGLRNNLAWLRLLEGEILVDQAKLDEASRIVDSPLLAGDCVLYQLNHGSLEARIAAALGNYDAAERMLLRHLSVATEEGLAEAARRCLEALFNLKLAMGDRPAAARYAARLRTLASDGQVPATIAAADLAKVALGDTGLGRRLVREYERDGLLFFAAQAHLHLATFRIEPARHLEQALEQFASMDAQLWTPRVLAQAKLLGLPLPAGRRPRTTTSERPALTRTEIQLVQLLRQGLTNRQIASVMHYSAKTIEVYVSRLYQKVGCHSRMELVLAAERGEISDLPAGHLTTASPCG